MRPLILAELTAKELDALDSNTRAAAAHAGHRLTLAAPQTFDERVANVQAEHEAQRKRDEDAARAQMRL